jgi:hypothetical protein
MGIALITVFVFLGVYLLDTMTPLGEPVWLLYLAPLVLSYWSDRYYAIPTVCIVTLLFLVGGFLASPAGMPVTQAILMRFSFFLIFICIAIVLFAIRRRKIRHDNLS